MHPLYDIVTSETDAKGEQEKSRKGEERKSDAAEFLSVHDPLSVMTFLFPSLLPRVSCLRSFHATTNPCASDKYECSINA